MITWQKLFNSGRLREVGDWQDISPADMPKHRIIVEEPVDDGAAFLMTGGEAEFLDYCPEHGCAAVIMKRDGTLAHAYPYRPDELATKRTIDLPYGEIMHDDAKDTSVFGLAPLPNGDLIIVYDFDGTTPYGGGIARMDKNGHLLWYRRDYSDHWPKITPENEILDISHNIGPGRVHVPLPQGPAQSFVCPRGMLIDVVRVLDFDGRVKEEIPVFEALFASPYRSRLLLKIDPLITEIDRCDPLHTNSVVLVGAELAKRLNDVAPDDLLISLRELSALAIIGRSDHSVKHLFTGSFIYQHSAQVVPGGKILLFDNFGSSQSGGPSRLLLYDPITREERTIFPNGSTADLESFSRVLGNINVSEDGARALFAVSNRGKAYEVVLKDGRVLTAFNNVHDVHTLPQFADNPKKVRYFTKFGVYYVSPHRSD